MSAIGSGKSIRKDKCVSCERDFQEDQLDLVPFTKTGKMEMLCPTCKVDVAGEIEGGTNTKGVKELKDTRKNVTGLPEPADCACALLPQCSALGFYEAFDNFTNNVMKAYFIRDNQKNYFKVDFCPFCGKRLYKK